jgi:hypothetical protein
MPSRLALGCQIKEICISTELECHRAAMAAAHNDFILLWMHRSGIALNFVLTLVGRPVFIYGSFVALFAIISHECTLISCVCVLLFIVHVCFLLFNDILIFYNLQAHIYFDGEFSHGYCSRKRGDSI